MYLLDTSVISDIVNDKSARHAVVKHFVQSNQLFVDQMFVSHVTLAEMRFGRELFLLRNPAPTQIRIDELDRHIAEAEKISEPLQISRHVTVEYGRLRAAYAKGIAPKLIASGKLKGVPPERWQQQLPAGELQITENDLWIAAIATTYDFLLVATDKDFGRIKKHYPQLKVQLL